MPETPAVVPPPEPATYPPAQDALPDRRITAGRYRLDFARSRADLDALLRLRFAVFNLELGEGLDTSHVTGRDQDPFDLSFHHLVIRHANDGVVGTYRMQTEAMAAAHLGYYADAEFDVALLPPDVLAHGVEIGRACVAKAHRNGRVLQLLWRGLASYLAWNDTRYLFGCCSLTSQDEALGLRTWAFLQREGHALEGVTVLPRAACACRGAAAPLEPGETAHIPALFQSYLEIGAKVCGPPAIDRAFRTIDFLVLLDTQRLRPHVRRTFFR